MLNPLLILAVVLGGALMVLLVRFGMTVGKKRELMYHARHIYVASLKYLGKSEEEDVALLVARSGFFSGIVLEKKIHHHFLASLEQRMDRMDQDLMKSFGFFHALR